MINLLNNIARMTRFALLLVVALYSATTSGATVPFTEDFSANASNWRHADGLSALNWNATGGPDGGAFVSTTFNFSQSGVNTTPLLFRGHAAYGSSSGAFVGDWVSDGVDGFGLFVRHDAGVPLNFFTRFASPGNFPGAAKVFVIPVASGAWTPLNAALPDPSLVFEGPFTYPQVFGNVGNVQIGVSVPASLAGVDQNFLFSMDKVAIVPEPATLALLAFGGLAAVARRARREAGRS